MGTKNFGAFWACLKDPKRPKKARQCFSGYDSDIGALKIWLVWCAFIFGAFATIIFEKFSKNKKITVWPWKIWWNLHIFACVFINFGLNELNFLYRSFILGQIQATWLENICRFQIFNKGAAQWFNLGLLAVSNIAFLVGFW